LSGKGPLLDILKSQLATKLILYTIPTDLTFKKLSPAPGVNTMSNKDFLAKSSQKSARHYIITTTNGYSADF